MLKYLCGMEFSNFEQIRTLTSLIFRSELFSVFFFISQNYFQLYFIDLHYILETLVNMSFRNLKNSLAGEKQPRDSKGRNQHSQQNVSLTDVSHRDELQHGKPLSAAQVTRLKTVLSQIYADIHTVSLPGSIEASTDLRQHLLLEDQQFSTLNWYQANLALQTRNISKVVGEQKTPCLYCTSC